MNIYFLENGIKINIRSTSDFETVEKEVFLRFEYKTHRYIHINCLDNLLLSEPLFAFIERLKGLSTFIAFELTMLKNIEILSRLYAAGVDFLFLWTDAPFSEQEIETIYSFFPKNGVFIKLTNNKENTEELDITSELPILKKNTLFEPIKRKVSIDILHFIRKLRVKEVSESFNSSEL